MRFFWSVVLAGGLLLVGFDAFDRRESRRSDRPLASRQLIPVAEDGTPHPPPPPPP